MWGQMGILTEGVDPFQPEVVLSGSGQCGKWHGPFLGTYSWSWGSTLPDEWMYEVLSGNSRKPTLRCVQGS